MKAMFMSSKIVDEENLHLNSGIGGLVALEPRGSWALVANEALFTLQHQDWAVDQVEVVPEEAS